MCDDNDSDSSANESEMQSECSENSPDLPKIAPGDVTLDTAHYMGCTECNEAPIGKGFDDDAVITHTHATKRKGGDVDHSGYPGTTQTPASTQMDDDVEHEYDDESATRSSYPNPVRNGAHAPKRRKNGPRGERATEDAHQTPFRDDMNTCFGGMEDDNDLSGPIDEFIPIGDRGSAGNGGSPSPGPSVHNPPIKKNEICWLCTFCMEEVAKDVTLFISSNISTIDTVHMASQIKDEILTAYPMAKGAKKRDILRHIREHMLHPHVKMASIIRSLITVAESLRTSIHQRDPESDCVIMDLKSIDMYLKVLTQIANAYKMDSSKLLFSNPSKT
jgi:hypothetical protein